MAITLLQSAINSSASGTTVSCSWPSATTSGNFLLATVSTSGGTGITITTPSGWTKVGEANNSTNTKVAIYYIENASTRSGSQSVTLSGSCLAVLTLAEYSGLATSSSLDQFSSSTGSGSTLSSGSITTTTASQIVVAVNAGTLAGTPTPQSSPTNSFTMEQETQTGLLTTLDAAFLDRIVSSTGTYSTSTTSSTTLAWAGMIASFKAAAAPPSYTLTGPGSGYLGAASSNFTVTGSNLTGSVLVTPSDGGFGGYFTPSTVTMTVGSPAQTFTYTAATTGTATISTTNGGGISPDPSPLSYAVSGYPTYSVSYASGYGAAATAPAPWMTNPSNTSGVAYSSSGTAATSVTLDYGTSVTISQFGGVVGYANSLTDQWEWSSDGITWHSLTVTRTYTAGAGGGSYTSFYQIWTPSSPITARYFRYSVQDSGGSVNQAGVNTLYGSPGANPVLGASGGTGGSVSGTTLYAGCWAPIAVSYDHSTTEHLSPFASIFPTPDGTSPASHIVVTCGTTQSVDGAAPTYPGNDYDGPTATYNNMVWGSDDDSDSFSPTASSLDRRYYFRSRWDAYWKSLSQVRLGFFFCNLSDYFFDGSPNVLSQYTTTANNHSDTIVRSVVTDYYVKKPGQYYPGPPPYQSYYWDITRVTDYYVGRYTIRNYTLPQIGTGRTATIPTVQFLNSTNPFEDGAPPYPIDPFEWILLCDHYGASGPTLGSWFVNVNNGPSDNDTHTSWNKSPYYFSVSGNETSLSVSVPQDSNPSAAFGTPLSVGLAYCNVTGQDVFESAAGPVYGVSATFVITEDLGGSPPVTGGPNAQTRSNADTFNNHICFAWISGSSATGALKCSVIRNATVAPGATASWESVQTIESANASDVGLTYLPSGRAYLCYDLSGSKKYRTNDGFGRDGQWSASATPNPAVSRHSAGGRGQQQAYRFRALTTSAAGDIQFSQCRDNTGALWTTPVTAVAGVALGPWCGGAYILDGYGLLYTKQSNNHIYFQDTVDPDNWTGVGSDTGKTGQVIGMTRLASGVLVAAVWDSTSKKTKALRSRDVGGTWEMDSSSISAVPSLDSPPCLVSIAHYAFLVWQINDVPAFARSDDGGTTWS